MLASAFQEKQHFQKQEDFQGKQHFELSKSLQKIQ